MPSQNTNKVIENFQNRPPPPSYESLIAAASTAGGSTGVLPDGSPAWTSYIPEAKVDKTGQVTSMGFRKDIVLTKLIEAGAPKDTIADFISKNSDVRYDDNIIFTYNAIKFKGVKEFEDLKIPPGVAVTKKGFDHIKKVIEDNPQADPYELAHQLAAHDNLGDYKIMDGYDDKGNSLPIVVSKKELSGLKDKTSPQDKLDGLVKLGILPAGTKLIGDGSKEAVSKFNKRYNTKIDPDSPYALPHLVKYSEDFQQQEREIQTLTNSGALNGDKLDLVKALDKGAKLAQLKAAGFKVTLKDIRDAQKVLDTINDPKQTPPELKEAFEKGGILAYEKAAGELGKQESTKAAIVRAGAGVAPMLTTEKAVAFKVEKSGRILREAYSAGGVDAYNKAIEKAYKQLEPYKNKDGSYNILDAMLAARKAKTNKEDMAIADALATVFPVDKVEQIRRDNLPRLTMGTEKGSIWGDSWSAAQASIPGWLVGASKFTKETPFSQDDAIIAGAIIVIAGGLTAKNIISNIRNNKVKGSSGSLVVLDENNARLLDPNTLYPTGGYISNIPPVSLPKGIPPLVPPYIKPSTGELLIPPSFKNEMEQLIGVRGQVMFLPTPAVRFKAEDYIMDYAGLKAAEQNLKVNIPRTDEIPIDWNKLLDQAKNQAAREKVFEDIDKAVADLKTGGYVSGVGKTETPSERIRALENYETAHEEYLRKLKIWLNAWESHIASLNPTPIRGKLDSKALKAIGLMELHQYINPNRVMHIHNFAEMTPERVLAGSPGIKRALEIYEKTYQKALMAGESSTSAEQQAKTALQRQLQRLTQAQVKLATQTQTQTRTQTRTQTQTKTQAKAAVKVATAEMEAEATLTTPLTAEMTRTVEATTTKIKKGIMLKRGGSDKEKRAIIADSGGAIAWRMGKVGKKDRWDTVINPYQSNQQYLMVLGSPPKGATIIQRGEGSAYATAQMLRGEPPAKPFTVDSGFMDIGISSKHRQINAHFTPDPKGLTKSDITIGQGTPRISEELKPVSERRGRISHRSNMRITPKMPKLR